MRGARTLAALACLVAIAGCTDATTRSNAPVADASQPMPTPTADDDCNMMPAVRSERPPSWWPRKVEPNVVWVDFAEKQTEEWLSRFADCAGLREILTIRRLRYHKYEITDGASVLEKVALVQAQPSVFWALPNPVGQWPESGDAPGNIVPRDMMVKFRGGIPTEDWLGSFKRTHGVRENGRNPATKWFWFVITDRSSVLDKAAELSVLPRVFQAGPNFYGELVVAVPADSGMS